MNRIFTYALAALQFVFLGCGSQDESSGLSKQSTQDSLVYNQVDSQPYPQNTPNQYNGSANAFQAPNSVTGSIIISFTQNYTAETGSIADVDVKLSNKPSGNVFLYVLTTDRTEGRANKTVLVFNESNWDDLQTITVGGIDDDSTDGDVTYLLKIGQSTRNDQGMKIDQPVAIQFKNLDNDPPPLKKPVLSADDPNQSTVGFVQRVLDLTNQHRARGANCGGFVFPPARPLTLNNNLIESARLHSLDMARRGYFSHNSQDGRKPADRMYAQDFSGLATGENIAAGYATPEEVVDGWIKSPGHCRNIMNQESTLIGIGYIYQQSSEYGQYWTQNFGRERPPTN